MSSDECYLLYALFELLRVCFMLRSRALPFCCAIWIGLNACNASPPPAAPPGVFEASTAAQPENQADLKQRQIAFLNRIRKSDPQHRTIERALFNDQNDLGLILNRSVDLDKIPALMRTIRLHNEAIKFANRNTDDPSDRDYPEHTSRYGIYHEIRSKLRVSIESRDLH